MLKIGVDIDGTIYPWTDAVNAALVERFGIADPGEHKTWNYLRDMLDDDQWQWVWSSDGARAVFGRAEMTYPGAVEAINMLADEHEVHFVTHRNPYRLTGITGEYLAQHFRNYRGVHVLDNSSKKSALADWDVFIDDKPETIDEFLFEGSCQLLLMPDRPWNIQHGRMADGLYRSAPGLERFERWHEVPELVKASVTARR